MVSVVGIDHADYKHHLTSHTHEYSSRLFYEVLQSNIMIEGLSAHN